MKKLIFIALALFSTLAFARLNPRLEDGLAITHPRILTTLQQRSAKDGEAFGMGIGLGYYLDPTGKTIPKVLNKGLSELPAFLPIMDSLNKEIQLFKQNNESKSNTVGVGVNYHSRLFDMGFLKDDRAAFFLIGVINRMDKAYENPQTCGETRLIFRLAYRVKVNPKDTAVDAKSVASRLPMTINLVLNTKSPDSTLTCNEIALRWKNLNVEGLTISQAADKIFADSGPLAPELRDRKLLKKLEINLQIARKAAAVRPDFGGHAVYLLKVYDWLADKQVFADTTLTNQVDRDKFGEFYKWLFDKSQKTARLKELDRGTIIIPENFLATRAYSIAPGGLSRLQNHPYSGLTKDEDLQKELSSVDLTTLQNIKSLDGLKRRMTDISCTGCHQTRAIGGFHFMGQDPAHWVDSKDGFTPIYPGNAVVVPGSGHFFSDLYRREKIQNSFLNNEAPDFSSGFSSRPFGTFDEVVKGLGISDGWGAHCHVGNDASFKNWTCSSGNKCLVLYKDSAVDKDMGVCVSQSGQELGDPTETGSVKPTGGNWYSDVYTRRAILEIPSGSQYVNSPQSPLPGTKTGGFPGGSIRTNTCDSAVMTKHPEGTCGALPAASSGFNDCIFDPTKTHEDCVKKYSAGVGLRSCTRTNPCRDDYICAESLVPNEEDLGVCVPPYFLFQFRVDGHPIKF